MSIKLKGSSVLVTGGAGFIGSHLVERLLNLGVKSIVVIDNLSTGNLDNLKKVWDDTRLHFYEELIQNIDLYPSNDDYDYIFHLAAEVSVPQSFKNPSDTYHENIDGFNEVLCYALKKNAKLIYASSSAVYGNTVFNSKIKEGNNLFPFSPYGLSKANNEIMAKFHNDMFNQDSVGLRFFNVYGTRQRADSPYSGVISIFNKLMKEGIQPTIYGDGNQTRDFIHVSDVANALIASVDSKKGAQKYNVGSGNGITINELYNSMREQYNFNEKPFYAEKRSGDIPYSVANIDRITSNLNWKPEVNLSYGLKNL